MGLMGSAFGRALAGGGEAAAKLTNKWIDEDLAQQRAQAIADIQRNSAKATRADVDAEMVANRPRDVQWKREDVLNNATNAADAATATNNNVSLAQSAKDAADRKAREDMERRQANAPGENKIKADATAADIAANSTPQAISAAGKLARAKHIESAGSIAQAALAQFQLGAAKTVQDLRTDLAAAEKTGDRKTAELIQSQLDAFTDRGGKAAQFATIAERASAAMTPALKIMADPMADADTKAEAAKTVQQQRAIMENFAKRAGVDLGAAGDKGGDPVKAKMDADRAANGRKPAGASGPAVTPAGGPEAARSAPIETTIAANGETMFRYRGQPQWYPSKEAALSELGRKQGGSQDFGGFERGY